MLHTFLIHKILLENSRKTKKQIQRLQIKLLLIFFEVEFVWVWEVNVPQNSLIVSVATQQARTTLQETKN